LKKPILVALAAAGILANGVMQAQAQPPARVRGVVTAINGDTAQLTTRQGAVISVDLTADTKFGDVTYAKITDIKPGSFVGTAAVPQPDGTLKALEVHVFAPDLRGSGEGTRAWQGGDGRTGSMTNGTVGDLIGTTGRTLTITYKGGQKRVIVPADVPIVFVEAGSRVDLTPGEHVIAFGQKAADGSLTAQRVLIGRGGVVPPM
jgi:Domain of unknown function (DUF5666)